MKQELTLNILLKTLCNILKRSFAMRMTTEIANQHHHIGCHHAT